MNAVVMVGRLTRDPEARYTTTGRAVANFRIAVDRRFKRDGQPDADFFPVVCFGKPAEFVAKYFKKGMKIGLSGSIQNDSYKDKDGVQHIEAQIVADVVEFVESKKESTEPPKDSDFAAIPEDFPEGLPFS